MDRSSACSSATSEISRTRSCRGVCVRLNIEAASLLPLAFRYVFKVKYGNEAMLR